MRDAWNPAKFLPALWWVLAAACSPAAEPVTVEIVFDGCGAAFAGSVAGVVIGPELAVTVAHGVIQGDRFRVDGGAASVVALDRRSDLALLEVPGMEVRDVTLASTETGAHVTVVGGLVNQIADARVVATPTIRIEEVLGTRRVERAGLELQAPLEEGDSGAGVFDDRKRMVGVVFAVNDERDGTAWAVSSREVETLLAGDRTAWVCDPAESTLRRDQP
ncbi:MAG: serine protease [Acidimicrobiia bacterium]